MCSRGVIWTDNLYAYLQKLYFPQIGPIHHQYPQALRCLEGTTLSNRGKRPRLCGPPTILCLEGSTPQDGSFFLSFYHGLDGFSGFACGGNRSKSLLLSLGLRPFSQVVMFIHASKLA